MIVNHLDIFCIFCNRPMTAGDGGCRPGTTKTPSSADNGRPAVIHKLGRDGRSWRRPVRPGKISVGTAVPGRRTGRLRSLPQYKSMHSVLGRYQKSGAPHKMRKFYTSTTTIERDSESEGSDSRPTEMRL
jgi:hypothetical protein